MCLFYRRHKCGEPLLCTEGEDHHKKRKHSKRENKDDYYMEKKDRRSIEQTDQ